MEKDIMKIFLECLTFEVFDQHIGILWSGYVNNW